LRRAHHHCSDAGIERWARRRPRARPAALPTLRNCFPVATEAVDSAHNVRSKLTICIEKIIFLSAHKR
jgi:hypothetical protein